MSRPREGTPEALGYGEPDLPWPPPHQRPLTRDEQYERDHRDAPDRYEGEDR